MSEVPEKSFRRDLIWAWVSIPITTCQPGHLESSMNGRKSWKRRELAVRTQRRRVNMRQLERRRRVWRNLSLFLFSSTGPQARRRRCGRSCHCRCSVSWMLLLQTRPRSLFKTALMGQISWVKSSTSVQSMHKYSKMQTWAIISTLLSLDQALKK